MRIPVLVIITAVALAFVPLGIGQDTVAWGSPVDGLRIGVSFASDPSKLTLRVLFENVGSDSKDILIGHEAGSLIYDSLNFVVTTPDGKTQVGLHRSVYTPTAGLILPFSERFNAGQTKELKFPLADIIFPSGTNVTLETLVKHGCSVRVQFEVARRSADWADLSRAWVGVVSSAAILPAH